MKQRQRRGGRGSRDETRGSRRMSESYGRDQSWREDQRNRYPNEPYVNQLRVTRGETTTQSQADTTSRGTRGSSAPQQSSVAADRER